MADLRSMKLDDSDWDALLRIAQARGLRDRTAAMRSLIADAAQEPAAQGSLLGTVEPAALDQQMRQDHIHDYVRTQGMGGGWVWVCKCGDRTMKKPE